MSNVYAFIPKESKDILTIPIPYIIKPKNNIIHSYILQRIQQEHPQIQYVGDLVSFKEDEFIRLLDDTFDELTPTDFKQFSKLVSKRLLEYRLGFLGTIKYWENSKRQHELLQQYYFYY